jgi:hypothetical protein
LLKLVQIAGSRQLLQSIGLHGEIIKTNGQGEQCITLALDDGKAFVGDLPPENMMGDYDALVMENWHRLKALGARRIKPAHAGEYSIK